MSSASGVSDQQQRYDQPPSIVWAVPPAKLGEGPFVIHGVTAMLNDFCNGSLADTRTRSGNVRLAPKRRHAQRRHQCLLSAKGGHWQLALFV
jgi:hypothetical protein